jgi:DNA topoisomerase VI subunit B
VLVKALQVESWCTGRLVDELQTKATASTAPQSLGAGDAAKLHHLLRSAHFAKPDGKHLSPAGEYNLRLGVIKELHPDLIATHEGAFPRFNLSREACLHAC